MSVSRDATSGWYCPATAAEWTELLAGTGISNPTHLWLCQEASGNLADSIGALALVASGTNGTYQSAVTGWTRVGVKVLDGNTKAFGTVDNSLPAIQTTSCLLAGYVSFGAAPTASRQVFCLGSVLSGAEIRCNATPRIQVVGLGNTIGVQNYTSAVRLTMLQVNRAASNVRAITDQENITTTVNGSQPTGKLTGIGQQAVACGNMTYMYVAQWDSTAAELTAAQLVTLREVMQNGPMVGSFTYAGTSSTSFVGAELETGSFTYAGTSSTSFVGAELETGSFTYAGTSSTSFVGAELDTGSFTYSGTSTASFIGIGVVAAAGSSSTSFVGSEFDTGSFTLAGDSAADFISNELLAAEFTFVGESTAEFIGDDLDVGVMSASGTSSAIFTSDTFGFHVLSVEVDGDSLTVELV